MWM